MERVVEFRTRSRPKYPVPVSYQLDLITKSWVEYYIARASLGFWFTAAAAV